MRILCSMPGKFGDILWSLATVRAIAETWDTPVDFVLSKETPAILPLLDQQPYIQRAFLHEPWIDVDTPKGKQIQPGDLNLAPYDRIYHLSYQGWPTQPLPFEIHQNACVPYSTTINPIDLDQPWVTSTTSPTMLPPGVMLTGFSDEWFELKVGLFTLLEGHFDLYQIIPPHSRWATELDHSGTETWAQAAAMLTRTKVFLGCNSGMHVLALALGKQVVMMEPNVQRHNPIFYPFGTEGRVLLVRGLDGQPTFDARHVAEALKKFA